MKIKKLLSMLLVAAMVASLLCVPVWAEDTAAAITYVEVENFSNYTSLAELTAAGWQTYCANADAEVQFNEGTLSLDKEYDSSYVTYYVSPVYTTPYKVSATVLSRMNNVTVSFYLNGIYADGAISTKSVQLNAIKDTSSTDSGKTNYWLQIPDSIDYKFSDGTKLFDTGYQFGTSRYFTVEFEVTEDSVKVTGDEVSTTIEGVAFESDVDYSLAVYSKSKGLQLSDFAAYVEGQTLTFDGDGAEGEVAAVAAVAGSKVTLPENGYTKEGSGFAGWTDGEAIYQPGDRYVMPENGGTLTAVWAEPKILTFDGDGAEGAVAAITAAAGSKVILPENEFSKFGYDFAGWTDGTDTYQAGEGYTMPADDTTLTAVWTESNEVAITVSKIRQYVTTADTYSVTDATSEEVTSIQRRIPEEKSGTAKATIYRFDVNSVLERAKNAEKVELSVYAKRENGKMMEMNVAELTSDWIDDAQLADGAAVTGVQQTMGTAIDGFHDSNDTLQATKNTYYEFRLDVTSAVENIGEDGYLDLLVWRGNNSTSNPNVIKGLASDNPPKLVITTEAEDCFTDKFGNKLENLTNDVNKCYIRVEGATGNATPILALYNAEGVLVKTSIVSQATEVAPEGTWVIGTIDLSSETIEEGYTLKMLVWDTNTLEPYTVDVMSMSK